MKTVGSRSRSHNWGVQFTQYVTEEQMYLINVAADTLHMTVTEFMRLLLTEDLVVKTVQMELEKREKK